jgi:5-methylcytosine-specific restriction endonuclease McrA
MVLVSDMPYKNPQSEAACASRKRRSQRWRKKHIENAREIGRIGAKRAWQKHKRRIAAAKVGLGSHCVYCNNVADLEFDHIDPTRKAACITDMTTANNSLFWLEVAKCQLACRVCHRQRTRLQRKNMIHTCPGW